MKAGDKIEEHFLRPDRYDMVTTIHNENSCDVNPVSLNWAYPPNRGLKYKICRQCLDRLKRKLKK